MKIRDIMTTDLVCADPETTLDEVATMMRDEDTGAIPVMDEDDLVGLITDRDIVLRCVAEGKDPSEVTADEIITEDLETVEPDDDIEEASRIMARKQIRRLPVVENGKLVGMISLGDIAVKHSEDVAGDALESVSHGVKEEPVRGAQAKARAKAHERSDVRQGRQQAISNQGAGKERQRQQPVVPIREQDKPASRRKAS